MAKQIEYPADTVGAAGKVWPTVGENIRKGAKEYSENEVKSIVDVLFPVGSVFCGENEFILSVGTWEKLTALGGRTVVVGNTTPSGERVSITTGDTENIGASLRFWKRVA